MVVREQFQLELDELKESIVELAIMAENALQGAIDAFYNQDLPLAEKIIRDDPLIDQKELEIHDKTVLLIAKQQPVATDLRRLIISLRIVTDIERMGDNAKNIAKSVLRLGDEYTTDLPHGLKVMRDMNLRMLETAMNAFKYEDVSVAHKLSEMDDKVDKQYKELVTNLLGEKANDPDEIQYVMQIAFTARYLERFADHITNIGESILFLVKGVNVDLND